MIVVFGTTHIMSTKPVVRGQQPDYERMSVARQERYYSTGRLEEALELGHDAYVCTVVPVLGPEHGWWRKLVPDDRIFMPDVLNKPMSPEQMHDASLIDPWRRFFQAIGRVWPEHVTDPLEFRETLDGSDGLLCGGRLRGFAGMLE
jgi:hypothetical protein